MRFEWDPRKAKQNLEKHGVSFEEACTVFFDEDALTAADEVHSDAEQRWITLGRSAKMRVLYVVTTEADEETVRIISARRATRNEVRKYEAAKRQGRRGEG